MCGQSAEYSHMLCVLQVDSWQKEQLRAETSCLWAQAKQTLRRWEGVGGGERGGDICPDARLFLLCTKALEELVLPWW